MPFEKKGKTVTYSFVDELVYFTETGMLFPIHPLNLRGHRPNRWVSTTTAKDRLRDF